MIQYQLSALIADAQVINGNRLQNKFVATLGFMSLNLKITIK